MDLNRNSPEWLYFTNLIDERIAKHRTRLESENTPVNEMVVERAKLKAMMYLKSTAEKGSEE